MHYSNKSIKFKMKMGIACTVMNREIESQSRQIILLLSAKKWHYQPRIMSVSAIYKDDMSIKFVTITPHSHHHYATANDATVAINSTSARYPFIVIYIALYST